MYVDFLYHRGVPGTISLSAWENEFRQALRDNDTIAKQFLPFVVDHEAVCSVSQRYQFQSREQDTQSSNHTSFRRRTRGLGIGRAPFS